MFGAGIAAGVAVTLVAGRETGWTGEASGRPGQGDIRTAATVGPNDCDEACIRSRGAAALIVLGQRPSH